MDNINLKFDKNGLIFILGKSGSGKSTLLNILSTFDTCSDGEYLIDGKNISKLSDGKLSKLRSEKFGFVFQDYNLLENLTVEENIIISDGMKSKKCDNDKIEELLHDAELDGYQKRKINELSGGQKQRVALLRALYKDAEVIFCDEPTGALDSVTSSSVFELLKRVSEKRIVIVVSHDREASEKYADRIIEIKDGNVITDKVIKDKGNYQNKNNTNNKKGIRFSILNKIAKMNLKKRKIRLCIAMILLTILSCLLGFSTSIASISENQTLSESMKDNVDSLSFYKKNFYMDEDDYICSDTKLGIEDKNYFESVGMNLDCVYSGFRSEINNFKNESYSLMFVKKANGYVETNDDFLSKYNLKVIAGRIPENDDETAISEYQFMMFQKYGYSFGNEKCDINSYNDILGKRIELYYRNNDTKKVIFTIVGVIDTKFDCEEYNDETLKNTDKYNEFVALISGGFYNVLFLNDGIYKRVYEKRFDNEICREDFYDITSFEVTYLNKTIKSFKKASNFNGKIYYTSEKNKNAQEGIIIPSGQMNALDSYAQKFAAKKYKENQAVFLNYNPEWTNYTYYYNYLCANNYNDDIIFDFTADELIQEMSFAELSNNVSYENSEIIISTETGIKEKEISIPVIGWYDEKTYGEDTVYLTDSSYALLENEIAPMITDYEYFLIPYNNLTKMKDVKKLENKVDVSDNIYIKYYFNNNYTEAYSNLSDVFNVLRTVFIFLAVILVPLTLFMIIFYFSGVVSDSKKDIGILRSLGYSKMDILKIYMFENLIISVIISILSVVLFAVLSAAFKNYILSTLTSLLIIDAFGIIPSLEIVLFIILFILLGTVIPLISVWKRKIILNISSK